VVKAPQGRLPGIIDLAVIKKLHKLGFSRLEIHNPGRSGFRFRQFKGLFTPQGPDIKIQGFFHIPNGKRRMGNSGNTHNALLGPVYAANRSLSMAA
jgi:hypothetical protein